MRVVILLTLLVLTLHPCQISGQSSNAFAGWVSLVTTPVGAFAPSVYLAPSSPAERPWGAQARYSHWQFAEDDDNTTNLGVGFAFAVGEGRVGVEIGRTTKKECAECDAFMLGGSLDLPLGTLEGGLAFALNPEIGFMTQSGDSDFSSVAAAVNLPVSYPIPAGVNATLVPFLAPGAGIGRASWEPGDSQSGQRLLLGGGVGIVSLDRAFRATASASKIFFDGGATVYGITLGIGR